jgi:hypothetical protein
MQHDDKKSFIIDDTPPRLINISKGQSYKPLLQGWQLLDFRATGSFQMFYYTVQRLFP